MHRLLLVSLTLALPPLAAPTLAVAQETSTVTFARGDHGTMVTGTVTGQDYMDYKLGAQAGQTMAAELTVSESNGFGTVYINILPPGSNDVAIYNSSVVGNAATVDLPESGTYTIRVYHMGDGEDSGKTSSFNLDLSIQ